MLQRRLLGRAGRSCVLAVGLVTCVGVTGAAAAPPAGGQLSAWSRSAASAAASSTTDRSTTAGSTTDRSTMGAEQSVTLVTGDRVHYRPAVRGGRTVVRVEPAEGRDHVRFNRSVVNGRVSVVPTDARSLIARGRLDRRLFELPSLEHAGAGGKDDGAVPLIVTSRDGAKSRSAVGSLKGLGLAVHATMPRIGAISAEVPAKSAATAWKGLKRTLGSEPSKLWLDGVRRPLLDESVRQIGAPAAWKKGLKGDGATTAILDSGIDASHPDLKDRVVDAKDFSESGAGDKVGHGTHVASIVGGTGAASDGKYVGVAPKTPLLDGKVCDDDGACSDSAILAAMEWAAVKKKAKVVNLSLGGDDTAGTDPVEQAVDRLSEQTGALFVVAAGNTGAGEDSCVVNTPSTADAALSVGAVGRDDGLADFSCVGPRKGDAAVKPDITAPGVGIAAAKAKGTDLGEPVGDRYTRLSGTSMATPHVAGAAAILAQQHPDWKGSRIKAALMASAKPGAEQTANQQGAGRLDVKRAIGLSVVPEQPSVSYGTQRWPHDDDKAITQKVTYRNLGKQDITLDVAATLQDPDGQAAPEGAVRLSADTVTVPAGKTAELEATVDTKHDGPDGAYTGRITATAGETRLTTPIGVVKEVESYDLTVKHLDGAGKPAKGFDDILFGLDDDIVEDGTSDADGIWRRRLPKGEYALTGSLPAKAENRYYELVQPVLRMNRDRTVTLDARRARPITPHVQRDDATIGLLGTGLTVRGSDDRVFDYGTINFGDSSAFYTAHVGRPASPRRVVSHLNLDGGVPGGSAYDDSPYLYRLMPTKRGRYFTGYDETVRDRDLAKVRQRFVRHAEGKRVAYGFGGVTPDQSSVLESELGTVDQDQPVDVYLTPGRDVQWQSSASQLAEGADPLDGGEVSYQSDWRSYRAGERRDERWGAAVNSPSLMPSPYEPVTPIGRNGDTIQAALSTYNDAAGHAGGARTASARTTLFREGKKVGSTDIDGHGRFDVPADPATYRLETSAVAKKGLTPFSTTIDASWTFRSEHVEQGPPQESIEDWKPLPAWALRFTPEVDDQNVNHDGIRQVVPVSLMPNAKASVGTPKAPVIELSGDDGRTWKKATVKPTGDNRWDAVAELDPGTKFVSVRGEVSDSDGNKHTQRVIRAYALGK